MIQRTWTRKIYDRDAEKKGIADEIIQAKEIDIAEGEKVLLKQRCENMQIVTAVIL